MWTEVVAAALIVAAAVVFDLRTALALTIFGFGVGLFYSIGFPAHQARRVVSWAVIFGAGTTVIFLWRWCGRLT